MGKIAMVQFVWNQCQAWRLHTLTFHFTSEYKVNTSSSYYRYTAFTRYSEPTDYTGDTRPCAILIPAWGSIWGSSGFFRNQNNYGLAGASRVKATQHAALWGHLFCICFCVCGLQKRKDPQIELHGWRRHYTGRYRKSGISGVYLWVNL